MDEDLNATHCGNPTFHPNWFIFFLFIYITGYLRDIDFVATWVTSRKRYADYTFRVVSYFHVQRSKFGKITRKSWTPQDLWELHFSNSDVVKCTVVLGSVV